MDLSQYRGNSNASKDIPVVEEREKMEPIASGRKIKQSAFRMIVSEFIADDIRDIGEYIVKDVAIPAIKNAISDAVSNGIDRLLFGETRNHTSGNSVKRITPYSSLYSGSSNRVTKYNEPQQARGLGRYTYQDILIPFTIDEPHNVTKAKAVEILSRMRVYLERYGVVSVGDLYDAAGEIPDKIDQDWGWYSLDGATIQSSRDGFILRMPKVESIK